LHEFDIKKHVFMNLTSSPLIGARGGGQRRGPEGGGDAALLRRPGRQREGRR
jgi:hypothetical protein